MLAATTPSFSCAPGPAEQASRNSQATGIDRDPDALAPAFLHLLRDGPHIRSVLDELRETSCQKLLFSATLTRDPSKIAALNLRDPKYFIVQNRTKNDSPSESGIVDVVMEKFTMPATLRVSAIGCFSTTEVVQESFHSGTYDCLWSFSETIDTVPLDSYPPYSKRHCLHEVGRINFAPRPPLPVLRIKSNR